MLELKKSQDVTGDYFFSQTGKSLGQKVDIKASRPQITVVCKNIDDITTKDGVRETLENQSDLTGFQKPAAFSAK